MHATIGLILGFSFMGIATVSAQPKPIEFLKLATSPTCYTEYGLKGGTAPVVTADLNHDGFTDLIFYCGGTFYPPLPIDVFLSDGHGGFKLKTSLMQSGTNVTFSVADVNGDGQPDILVFSNTANTAAMSLYLGIGDGTFNAPVSVALPNYVTFGTVGDFNGDGKPDLAVISQSPNSSHATNISILMGNGDGTFGAPKLFTTGKFGAATIAVGDFNGDGKQDIAFTQFLDYQNNTFSVVAALGNGDGTFQPAQTALAGPYGNTNTLLAADFNKDGLTDLSLAAHFNRAPQVTIALSLGGGKFAAPVVVSRATEGVGAIVIGDLNNDGILDLVVSESGGVAGVLFGKPDGTFQSEKDYAVAAGSPSIALGKFDSSGNIGLAAFGYSYLSHSPNGYLTYVPVAQDGALSSPPVHRLPVSPGAYSQIPIAADFDGDGKLDLATTSQIFLGNGNGTFSAGSSIPYFEFGVTLVGPADLNGDGKPDLIAAAYINGGNGDYAVNVLLNDGSGNFPISNATSAVLPFNFSLQIADVNNDGRLDLVYEGETLPMVNLGNGDGTFGPTITSQLGSFYFGGSFLLGDFNNDGKVDLLSISGLALGNGDGTFQPPLVTNNLGLSATADLNHDGNLDLVFGALNPTAMAVQFGNGDGTFQPPVLYPFPSGNPLDSIAPIQLIDMNGDGILDIAVAMNGLQYFLAGKGDGTFMDPEVMGFLVGPVGVYAFGDFFNHGLPDMLTSFGKFPQNYVVMKNATK